MSTAILAEEGPYTVYNSKLTYLCTSNTTATEDAEVLFFDYGLELDEDVSSKDLL